MWKNDKTQVSFFFVLQINSRAISVAAQGNGADFNAFSSTAGGGGHGGIGGGAKGPDDSVSAGLPFDSLISPSLPGGAGGSYNGGEFDKMGYIIDLYLIYCSSWRFWRWCDHNHLC